MNPPQGVRIQASVTAVGLRELSSHNVGFGVDGLASYPTPGGITHSPGREDGGSLGRLRV